MSAGSESELNVVPYLDIMINLILFVMMTTLLIPEFEEVRVDTSGGATEPGEVRPSLTVAITGTAYTVLSEPSEVGTLVPVSSRSLPELARQLREAKTAMPGLSDTLVVTADPAVPYREVVAVLDTARRDAQGPLFPSVTLAQAR